MFKLEDYEDVASRIDRLYKDYSDARIVTINHTTSEDRSVSTWVFETRIYLSAEDQAADLPKGTGWAFEVDGVGGMANKTSAMENAETSSIGRAVSHALAGYSGNKKASRTEMAKVNSGVTPKATRNWRAEANGKSVEELRLLWGEASASKADQKILDYIKELANGVGNTEGELYGDTGSSASGKKAGRPAKSQTI